MKRILAIFLAICITGCGSTNKPQKEEARRRWSEARAGVLCGLARQQFESGNYDNCRKTLDEAQVLDSRNIQLRLISARLNIEQGKLEQAERDLKNVREMDPKCADACYFSGVVFQRWQKSQVAYDFYTQAAELQPAELAYLLARAEMLVVMDRPGEALSLLQEKVAYFENSATIRDAVGQLLLQQGKTAQAVDMLRQANILAPDEGGIREHLAMATYRNGQYREAAVLLERMAQDEKFARRADLLIALGECQLQLGKIREAKENLEAAVQIDASSPNAHLSLAKAALQLGDQTRAEVCLKKSLAIAPQSIEANVMLGYLRLRQNRLAEALSAFRKANAAEPGDTVSLCMMGYLYEKLGQSAEAIACYAKALKIKPNDELALQLMAGIE